MDESVQREILRRNGWLPIGAPLGIGGGARVFKVVSKPTIDRLTGALQVNWRDRHEAKQHESELAEAIASIADNTESVIAAGKVAHKTDWRSEREIRILRDVQHPNLIRALGYDESLKDASWYVMPLMRGGTVKGCDLVGDLPRVLRGMLQIAGALEALHAKDIVHRDLKPANIFVGDEGDWILGDPGVAFREDDGDKTTTRPVSKDWFPRWDDDPLGHTPTVDVYMLALTAMATLLGEKPLARHWLTKDKFNLVKRFPDAPGVQEVFDLLYSLLADDQASMRHKTGGDLRRALEPLVPLVEDHPLVRLERQIHELRDQPRLLFNYFGDGAVSGPIKSLDRIPLWIPAGSDALRVWSRAKGDAQVSLEIQSDGQAVIQEQLRHGVENTIAILHKRAILGSWSILSVRGQSGLLQHLSIYAD
jgi:serine/threonine protein kinase